MVTKQRNRADTEAKLITAMGQLLAEKGFAKVGINAVARQAQVDKVLIYRYFDGLDGLIQAYAASSDFWPSVEDILGVGDERQELLAKPYDHILSQVFQRYADEIRSRPLSLEILAWETIERNSLTIALEDIRENTGLELMAILSEVDAPDIDWQAVSTIFSSAIHYLAIRGRKIKLYNGMNLNEEDGWNRLAAAMHTLITSVK